MRGVHDLGGREGFGPVVVEPNEPPFHADWERVARGLSIAVLMKMPNSTSSAFRHAIERMGAEHYLTSSYYEHWLTAAATLAVESDLVSVEELAGRTEGSFPLAAPVATDAGPVDTTGAGRFAVGDRVRVRQLERPGHTRCPSYIQGHTGIVTRADGTFSLPDVEAHSTDRVMELTYSVRFEAHELWPDAERGVTVNVDLWDSYLEAV